MSLDLLEQLQSKVQKPLQLNINDNRSTMLSVRWEPDFVRVSLHRMFLQAPSNVMDALACYIRKGRRKAGMDPAIRRFIDSQFDSLDYSKRIDQTTLETTGSVFDLQKIYDKVNKEYFQSELDLSITWYGKIQGRMRNQFNFGLYYYPLKLIKIHKALDHLIVPQYLVEFVIYHEMIHHVCRPHYDEKGIHRIHTKEFKARERQFLHYKLAKDWLKKNRELFFNGEMG